MNQIKKHSSEDGQSSSRVVVPYSKYYHQMTLIKQEYIFKILNNFTKAIFSLTKEFIWVGGTLKVQILFKSNNHYKSKF